MSDHKKTGGYISQAWLVILLALAYGAALAGVQTGLGPIIDENKKAETFSVVPQLVPGADGGKTESVEIKGKDGRISTAYKAISDSGAQQGWVLPGSGQGFADRIDLLIGLTADASKITGIYILDQKETPGLGNYIVEEDFRKHFVDKSTAEPLCVVKAEPARPNEVRAVTGATISSESVTQIVNKTIENFEGALREQTGKQ